MPKQNCYHGPAFSAIKGTIQGGHASQTLFNIALENFIQTWLEITVEDHRVAHDGMVEAVRQFLGVFYTDDGIVVSRDAEGL